jgi:calcineurin-like phosphoesterase family protein
MAGGESCAIRVKLSEKARSLMNRKVFFSADHHFGHTNILNYEAAKRVDKKGRTFSTVERMNEHLIGEWNAVVSPGDLVYYLGDFAFKAETTREVLKQLNGEKILVIGNHDPHFKSVMRDEFLQVVDGFSEVYKQF